MNLLEYLLKQYNYPKKKNLHSLIS